MTTMIILSVVVVAVLGLICGVILAVASKVMEVKEDERIGQGRENVRIYLKEHPEVTAEIETAVRAMLVGNADAAATEAEE